MMIKAFPIAFSWLVSIAMGVVVWLPLNALNEVLGNPPNDAWSIWYWIGYPAILVVAAVLGYLAPGEVWRNGPAAVFASYVAALYLVPQTGNLLPFELLWMGFLSVLAAWVGKTGKHLKGEG